MQSKPIKIVIVDDHPAFSQGLKVWIEKNTKAIVVNMYTNGQGLLDTYRKVKPDYVFMDVRMPGLNGIETTKKILEIDPKCKVVIMTMFDEPEVVKETMALKISGFITKDILDDEFAIAVKKIMNGENYITDKAARNYALLNMTGNNKSKNSIPEPDKKNIQEYGLTEQEIKIIKLIATGNSDKKVSDKLHISPRTVGWHKTRIMKKISAKKSTEIVAFAYNFGLI
jgi:two-component system response regulator NreC